MALSSYLLAGSRAASPSLPSFPSLRRRSYHRPPPLATTPLPLPSTQRWRRSLRFCASSPSSSPPPPVPPEDEEPVDYEVVRYGIDLHFNRLFSMLARFQVLSQNVQAARHKPQESSIRLTYALFEYKLLRNVGLFIIACP